MNVSVLVRERFNTLMEQLKNFNSCSNEKEIDRVIQSLCELILNLSYFNQSHQKNKRSLSFSTDAQKKVSKSKKEENDAGDDEEEDEDENENEDQDEAEEEEKVEEVKSGEKDEKSSERESEKSYRTEAKFLDLNLEEKLKELVHFRCTSCFSFMNHPTTSIFGQTTCQTCQDSLSVPKGIAVNSIYKLERVKCENNFNISFLANKGFQKEISALKLKDLSNERLKEGKNKEAIDLLNQAIEIAPSLYILFSNRSAIYYEMKQYELALKDAETAINLTFISKSPKVLIRRANPLAELKKYEDSIANYVVANQFMESPQVQMKIKRVLLMAIQENIPIELANLIEKVNHLLNKDESKCLKQIESEDGTIRGLIKTDTESEDKIQCTVCYSNFYQPVTTPCGHSFCKSCLVRSLDHRNTCPLCRSSLEDYLSLHQLHINNFYDRFVQILNPEGYNEKKASVEQEEELSRDLPIFVCSLALPGSPCPLHIFEPRYRLMMRRCMESGKKVFGMCLPTSEGFTEYGTVLYIRNFELLPDGRSLVDTIGTKRFKVIDKYIKDGYNVGKVEYYEDEPITPEEQQEVDQICNSIRNSVNFLSQRIPSMTPEEFFERVGTPPEKPSDFSFWCVNLIPFEPPTKYEMLRETKTIKRLRIVSSTLARNESRCSLM